MRKREVTVRNPPDKRQDQGGFTSLESRDICPKSVWVGDGHSVVPEPVSPIADARASLSGKTADPLLSGLWQRPLAPVNAITLSGQSSWKPWKEEFLGGIDAALMQIWAVTASGCTHLGAHLAAPHLGRRDSSTVCIKPSPYKLGTIEIMKGTGNLQGKLMGG